MMIAELQLYKGADTPFHIQGDELSTHVPFRRDATIWLPGYDMQTMYSTLASESATVTDEINNMPKTKITRVICVQWRI